MKYLAKKNMTKKRKEIFLLRPELKVCFHSMSSGKIIGTKVENKGKGATVRRVEI